MAETLGQKQERFSKAFALWTLEMVRRGYGVRMGEALRSDEQAEINALGPEGRKYLVAILMPHFPELARRIANNTGSGIRNSLHEIKLAADPQLFYQGQWISDGASEHWLRAGMLWESMGADHCWGGRFGDANHLSISHEGRK